MYVSNYRTKFEKPSLKMKQVITEKLFQEDFFFVFFRAAFLIATAYLIIKL